MKAITYTRVSSDEQVEGTSLGFQREDCRRYATEKGFDIAAEFEERGESAKFADRPELLKLLEYCKKHARSVDALIVWKLDRLSRNQMDYYFIKRTLLEHSIAIHSATEPSLDDPNSIAGRVFETFSALQAEIDNSMRRERVIRGMAAKIHAGIYPWMPPLGYRCARTKAHGLKKLEPDQPDAARFRLIERLFRLCLEQGRCRTTELARLANEWGLRSRAGKRLYPQAIERLLSNKFYAGILVDPWSKEEIPGRHRPMLTPEEFDDVQRIRRGKRRQPARRRHEHPDFPLRHVVRCGACDTPLTGSWSRGNGGRYAYYHCPKKSCGRYGKGTRTNELERLYTLELLNYTPSKVALAAFATAVAEVWKTKRYHDREAAEIREKKVGELRQRLDGLIEMRMKNLLSDEEFLERKNDIQDQIAERQGGTAETAAARIDVVAVVQRNIRYALDFPRIWKSLPAEIRRWFEKTIFPEGIFYERDSGFRTKKVGLCYELIERSSGSKSRLVHLVYESWNQVADDLTRRTEEFSEENLRECERILEECVRERRREKKCTDQRSRDLHS